MHRIRPARLWFFGLSTVLVLSVRVSAQDCPAISASCPDAVDQGQPITFTVTVGALPDTGYKWTVSVGIIKSGQGTPTITVDSVGLGGQNVTATVEVSGLNPACQRTSSCTTLVRPPPIVDGHFDEYGNIRFNDEKARLDNFAIQLQNEPTATGYIVAYGSCAAEGASRARRAKGYLVNTRGLQSRRVVVIDGGCLRELMITLMIAPQGASAPSAEAIGVIGPCPACKKPPINRRSRRKRS